MPITWGLDRTDQRELPLDGTYAPFTDNGGEGVKAFIIDTGIYIEHEDFGGRAEYGFNAIDYESHDDFTGHGTHVAGTVGGTTWAASPARSKRPNCMGSATKLLKGVMDFSSDGPVISCSAVSAGRRRRNSSQNASSLHRLI